MHDDPLAIGLDDAHPLLAGLAGFLKRSKIPAGWIEFVTERMFFAYPGTAWFRLAAAAPEDVKNRHELHPHVIGQALNGWLSRRRELRRIVFDLRGMTIVDIEDTLALFDDMQRGLAAFYLADVQLADVLRATASVPQDAIFTAEKELISYLRNPIHLRLLSVLLPECLTLWTLNEALKKYVSRRSLQSYDVLVLDMTNVLKEDFQALSMLAPLIQDAARRYGILSWVVNPRRKLAHELTRYGALRVVKGYLVEDSPGTVEPRHLWPGMDMKAFTRNELHELESLCEARFVQMLIAHEHWFKKVMRISTKTRQRTVDRRARLLQELRQLIWELAENVAYHSEGLGFIMMDLEPATGLHIYVGDTGIGLRRGLVRAYKTRLSTEREAVSVVLKLGLMRNKRRRFPLTFASGGRGYERVRLILRDLGGQLWIRSRDSIGVFSPGGGREPQELRQGMYDVLGTHLHILIPTRSK